MPRDRDQDGWSSHCAKDYTGGWWYHACDAAHPTGLSSATRIRFGEIERGEYKKYISYQNGGDRGTTDDSWSEAEYLLVPN